MQVFRFKADALGALGRRIFTAVGAPPDTAAVVAASLVDANLAGHDSHGVLRIPQYVRQVHERKIAPAARPRILMSRKATALVSGEWGFGQPAGCAAVEESVRLAREFGIGAVGLVRCNHLGRVGEYVEIAAIGGCAAMVWLGGLERHAVPHGGTRGALGTNPLAVGFPLEGEPPAVLDFATTAAAAGKLMAARAAGKPVPPGWVVDAQGRPATDPQAFFEGGALLPFGGHKGYALAVMIELLGQALTGADEYGGSVGGSEITRRSGALFCAIDTAAFRPAGGAAGSARRIVDRLRSNPPAPGVERVLIPGEPEARTRQARSAGGVELPEETWRALVETAEAAGLAQQELPQPAIVTR
jgi:LDH2 family malate/lactate/ureidoglycolate dehydrogenase